MDNTELTKAVNSLIENSKDREYGFRHSAEHARSADLQALFSQWAQSCHEAAAELRQLVVEQLSNLPQETGSVSQALHRGWVAVKGAVTSYQDADLLRECERAEHEAVQRYSQALARNLPEVVQVLLLRQSEAIKQQQLRLCGLLDAASPLPT